MISRYGKIWIPGLCACVLAVAACQTSTTGQRSSMRASSAVAPSAKLVKASSAENLLDAEGGPFRMVELDEEDPAEISPLEAHMRARKNVHPAETKTASAYTRKYDPSHEEGHVRVLRLEPVGGGTQSVSEPAQTQYARADISVIPPIKPDFDAAEEKGGTPTPKHKPQIMRLASGKPVAKEPKGAVTGVTKAASASYVEGGNDGLSVAGLRFGDHPGKTRVVIDLTNKTAFSHHLSDQNRLLDIDIAGAAWDAGLEAKILQHPLILGYRAQSDQKGTHLSLKLKKPGRVVWSAALKPDHGKGDRLVFDIAAL